MPASAVVEFTAVVVKLSARLYISYQAHEKAVQKEHTFNDYDTIFEKAI